MKNEAHVAKLMKHVISRLLHRHRYMYTLVKYQFRGCIQDLLVVVVVVSGSKCLSEVLVLV